MIKIPESKILEIENKAYEVRAFVPKFIKNGYLNKINENDAMLGEDYFVSNMLLNPKLTIEQVGDMPEHVVDSLFYKIIEITNFMDMDIVLDSKLSDEERAKKLQESNQKRVADLKKKVTLR